MSVEAILLTQKVLNVEADDIRQCAGTGSVDNFKRKGSLRTFFIAVCFALLDPQVQLYQAALDAGITLLSIGHRPALRSFHSVAVHFDGHQVCDEKISDI